MANTTGDIRTVDEILGDEVQFSLKAGRSYIILSLSCVETITKQWKDKLQEVWELQELNEHLEDKLKEQQETIDGLGVLQKVMETVEPVPDYNVRYWRCPKCNWLLTAMIDDKCDIPNRRDNYCSSCGRPLKWQ